MSRRYIGGQMVEVPDPNTEAVIAGIKEYGITEIGRHSTRVQCLDEDCGWERASTNRLDTPGLRYMAQSHVRGTGHRVQFSVLNRTIYEPDDGGE